VVLIIALLLAIAALQRPSFALFLVFAGAGLASVVVPLSFHTMHSVEATLWLCLPIVFLRRPALRLRLPHLLALLFLGIGIVSFIHVPSFSTDLNAHTANKELYEIALFTIAFFVGTFLAKYIENGSSFLVAILASNIPLYLVGLAQAAGIHVLSQLETSGAQDSLLSGGRLWGPFVGAATFGAYLVNLFAVAVACWVMGTRRRDRIIGAVAAFVTVLEIVGSGTRSASIAAVITFIVALIITRRFKLMIGIITCAGLALPIFLNLILSKFMHDDASANNRLFLWQLALQLIHSNPWIGIGLSQFQSYYSQLIVPRSTQLNPDGISIHNQYLVWAVESGVIWAIAAIALLISIIFLCGRAYRSARNGQRTVLLAAILAVLANMVVGFLDVPFEKTEGAVFLFLLAGLALGQIERIHRAGLTPFATSETVSTAPARAASPTGLDAPLYHPKPLTRREHSQTPPASPQAIAEQAVADEEAPNVRKTGQSVIFQVLAWGISAAISFPATALLTRHLGPVQYGEYIFTIPFLSIAALFSGTGMDPFITRTLTAQARSKWGETLSYAAGTRLLTTMAVSSAAALIASVMPVGAEQRVLLYLGIVCLLFSYSFNGLRTVFECGFWAEQRLAIPSLIEAVDRVVTSGLVVAAVLFHLSLIWTYILITYSDLPFFLVLALLAGRRYGMGIRFSIARSRDYIVKSLSLTIHNALSLVVNQANLLLLLPLAGSLSVGIYGLALRITSPLLTIAISYVIALYPLLCSRFTEGRERFSLTYGETIRIAALGSIPLAALVSVHAHDLVLLLGGVTINRSNQV
jgi:O-antigen/teichoic acid export membrane protein